MKTIVLLLAFATTANAQMKSSEDLINIRGQLKPFPVANESWGYQQDYTVALKTAAKMSLMSVFDIIKRTPSISQPVGYTVVPFRGMIFHDERLNPAGDWAIPTYFTTNFILHWMREDDGVVHTNGEGEGIILRWEINSIGCIFDELTPVFQDEKGGIYDAPVVVGERFGFPQYRAGCILMTKSKQPPFLPATQERVLRNLIAEQKEAGRELEKMLAALKQMGRMEDYNSISANDAPRRNRVARLQQLLTSMSPAERTKAAYFNMKYPSLDSINVFADLSDPAARALVTANPAFYDKTLPRSAIQSIAGNFGCWHQKSYANPNAIQADCEIEPENRYSVIWGKMRDEVDWKALLALVQGGAQ